MHHQQNTANISRIPLHPLNRTTNTFTSPGPVNHNIFEHQHRNRHHSNRAVVYPVEETALTEVATIRNTTNNVLGPPAVENDPHSASSATANFIDAAGRSPSDDEQRLIVGNENASSSYQLTERSFSNDSNTAHGGKFYAATAVSISTPKEKLAFENQVAVADIEHEEAEADKGSLRSPSTYYYQHPQIPLSQEMPSSTFRRNNNNMHSPYTSQHSISQQQQPPLPPLQQNKSAVYPGRILPSPADAALNAFVTVAAHRSQQNPLRGGYGVADSRISLTPSVSEIARTTPYSDDVVDIAYITPSHTGASDIVGGSGDAPRSRSRRRSDRFNHQVKPLQDVTADYVNNNVNLSTPGVNNKFFQPHINNPVVDTSDAVLTPPVTTSDITAGDRSPSTSSTAGSTSMSGADDEAAGIGHVIVNELEPPSTITPKKRSAKKRFVASVSVVNESASPTRAAASGGDKENHFTQRSFSRQPSSSGGAKQRRNSGKKFREQNITDATSTAPSPTSLDGSTSSGAPVLVPSSQDGLSPAPSPQPPSSTSKYVKFTDVFDTDRSRKNSKLTVSTKTTTTSHPSGLNKSKSVPAEDSAIVTPQDAIQIQDMYRQLNNLPIRAVASASINPTEKYKSFPPDDHRLVISRADVAVQNHISIDFPEHHTLGVATYGASSPDIHNDAVSTNGLRDGASPISVGLSTTANHPNGFSVNSARSRTNSGASSTSSITTELQFLRTHRELLKTLVAIIFLLVGWLATISALAYSHDRIPMTEPLPDIIFSIVPIQAWALKYSEYIIVIGLISVIVMVVTHKYRWVVFRRICVIVGLLYMGRSITMLVTGLPPPDINYPCEEQLKHTAGGVVLKRILQFLVGGGMSFRGYYTLCGDYIYSGHTCVLVVFYLLLREYAPRKLFVLTVIYGILGVLGVILVSISRGHYTVDIVIAYWVTTRTFWIYHSLASNPTLKNRSNTNYLSRIWWFPIFHYLEGNVPASKLPNHYEWPLPWPRRWANRR